MDNTSTPARPVRRRGRHALTAAAAALGLAGITGLVYAATATGPAPNPAPPAAATSTRPATSTGPGELTTGPLMATSKPTEVSLPTLKVASALIALGLQPDGTMQVPDDASTVGWYTKAPTPGSLGPAVLAGHVNWRGHDGAFAKLHTLQPGDPVTIRRQDGSVAMFEVTRTDRYPKDRFPTGDVYGPIDHAGLRLITCGGEFDTSAHSYRDNIVVYATLSHAHPAG